MIYSDIDMIANDMVCIAERADGKGKVEGYYFCLHHNDGRKHLHHLIIPLEVDLSKGTPLDQIQVEVTPESVTLKVQEPRVMTREEVLEWATTPAEKRDPIFFEQKKGKGPSGWICNSLCPKDYYLCCLDKDARCWTSRPTDEQREEVEWE